ncbi:hypothetical protein [Pseudodesulfovibrio methanolicus]|uniref:Transposase zinc-ribbon domain-containing protein n=1 Tax=Pseudodesulfovibrio methanolicus TaxID=3126690 RepID=A0ABZ2IY63_9BACT
MYSPTAIVLTVGVIGYLIWANTGFYSWWVNKKKFEDFKTNNPGSFDGNKFISCPACGGDYIFVRNKGKVSSHLCKQCGKELWRSRT